MGRGVVAVVLAVLFCSPLLSASLKRLVENVPSDSKLPTLDDFLAALPSPLLSSPTFVYRSQSIQGASLAAPRALLSDDSGDLVIAFNGGAGHQGYDQIEAMEFDATARKFNFYELGYAADGALHVSEANPAKCLTCHRSDPRPNWESYDQWPGVYGSKDDRLADEEIAPYQTFLSAITELPRYAALHVDHLLPVLKYSSHYGRLPGEPNISFTHRLSHNNFKRVARLIAQSKEYDRYKFMIAGFLGSNDGNRFSTESYLPDNLVGSSGLRTYYAAKQITEAQAHAGSITVNADVPSALTFRSLFESRGVDTSDWFLNFKGGLTNTFLNGVSWEGQLLEALLEEDSSLKKFVGEGSAYQLDIYKLQEESRAQIKLDKLALSTYETDATVPARIWNTSCRQCHEVPELKGAPHFGFAEAVKKARFTELVTSGAMPPGKTLTPSEKARLLSPVKLLSH